MKIIAQRKLFWYVTVIGSNGEVLLTSETYYNKSNCIRAAKKLSSKLGCEYEIK